MLKEGILNHNIKPSITHYRQRKINESPSVVKLYYIEI